MREYQLQYLKGLFVIDCIAVLPGLFTKENQKFNVCKLARFVHWQRFFDQVDLLVSIVLMNWLGYTRQKVSEYVDFIKLEFGVLMLTHIMAIIWIAIGLNSEVEGSWVNTFIDGMKETTGN